MMIVSAYGMLSIELLHGLRIEILVHLRLTVHESLHHFAVHSPAEPIIDDITRESPFFTVDERTRKIGLADLAMKPLLGTASHFEARRQFFSKLHDFLIQIRYSQLETVGHGQLIRVHQ